MSSASAVARVYAQALIDIGASSGEMSRIVTDLHELDELYAQDPWFRGVLITPRLDRATKWSVIRNAVGDKLCRPVLGLLKILIDKERGDLLDNVADEFDIFRDEREGRLHAWITSARAVDPAQLQQISGSLAALSGKQVEIHERIDPAVIGGVIVRVGDHVLDGSLQRRLESLRRSFAAAQR